MFINEYVQFFSIRGTIDNEHNECCRLNDWLAKGVCGSHVTTDSCFVMKFSWVYWRSCVRSHQMNVLKWALHLFRAMTGPMSSSLVMDKGIPSLDRFQSRIDILTKSLWLIDSEKSHDICNEGSAQWISLSDKTPRRDWNFPRTSLFSRKTITRHLLTKPSKILKRLTYSASLPKRYPW